MCLVLLCGHIKQRQMNHQNQTYFHMLSVYLKISAEALEISEIVKTI